MTTAFLLLGLLVGNLIGLSAQSVVVPFLGLAFALAGGSLVAFVQKLVGENRRIASQALGAFSAATIIGLYLGIAISEWQLLSPKAPVLRHVAVSSASASAPAISATTPPSIEGRKYLRASHVSAMREIDRELFSGHLKPEEAYDRLYRLCNATED